MRHTEHKSPKDEELIAHIRHTLKNHEEPYPAGAWESFNAQQQSRKRPFVWIVRLSGAAAVLAVAIALFWFKGNAPVQDDLLTKAQPAQKEILSGETAGSEHDYSATTPSTLAQHSSAGTKRMLLAYTPQQPVPTRAVQDLDGVQTQNTTDGSHIASVQQTADVVNPAEEVAAVKDPKPDTERFLANESQAGEKPKKLNINPRQKKWDMALMLAPSFGNTNDLNMGYGISMSYHFSDRLSLSSGVTYNKMNARKNLPTTIGLSPVILGNNKSLEMISEEVSGIDVPLELRYHVNKNIYANVGVSGFAVLNQSRNNTFVQEVVVKSTSSSSGASGGVSSGGDLQDAFGPKGQFANSYIVNQRTTEKVADAAMNKINYMGFYNLSVGYTRKIYKNHALSIEPFVKLPVNGASRDNLRMEGKGIRVKVGF
ncbi:hypothetical protein D9M68_469260 [compost metagenome]